MVRGLFAALLAALAFAACVDFESARIAYDEELAKRAVVVTEKKVDGDVCIEDSECESDQCVDGFCRRGQAGLNQSCSETDDCTSPLFCEPVAELYLCIQAQSCPGTGRLCSGNLQCSGGGACPSLSCVSGVCRPSSCTAGSACTSASDCCSGFGCTRDGGCQPHDGGVGFPAGFVCRSPVECESGACGATGVCREDAGVCNGIGAGCGGNCCTGLECSQATTTCCVGNARVCRSDSDCCSGQCLDGVCAASDARRQLGLPCSEDNDCFSNRCHVDTKRCVAADAGS